MKKLILLLIFIFSLNIVEAQFKIKTPPPVKTEKKKEVRKKVKKKDSKTKKEVKKEVKKTIDKL